MNTLTEENLGHGKQKKMQKIELSKMIEVATDKLWNVMVTNFGHVANYTPTLYSSKFLTEPKEEVGCERYCSLNKSGKKYLIEQLDFVDKKNYTYRIKFNKTSEPINKELSFVQVKLIPITENTTKIELHMEYRTIPAFLGSLSKGAFIKIFKEMFIGVEHYANTGEKVNANIGNYKRVKKNYQH